MAAKQTQVNTVFSQDLLGPVKNYLVKHKETIAVAESVTSGLLQVALGTIEDASCFYQGGITAYNLGQKYRHLLIEPIHALECNCVSQQVANEMAANVCILFKSNWGLSITGYATPTKETSDKIFAYFSIACNNKIILAKKIIPQNTEPFAVQLEYAQTLLQHLVTRMHKKNKTA
jgi:PncC family amidohydrolase